MSLLMFELTESSILIITDTLATKPDRTPSSFSMKIAPLPHLNMAVASTGRVGFWEEWRYALQSLIGAPRDIDDVNAGAPDALRQLRDKLEGDGQSLAGGQRIMHFGFRLETNRPVVYEYDSDSDFEPTAYESNVFWSQPLPRTFAASLPRSREDVIDLAVRLRDENMCGLPGDDSVSIGGELYATALSIEGIHTERWHRFDDYDETAAVIQQRITGMQPET